MEFQSHRHRGADDEVDVDIGFLEKIWSARLPSMYVPYTGSIPYVSTYVLDTKHHYEMYVCIWVHGRGHMNHMRMRTSLPVPGERVRRA